MQNAFVDHGNFMKIHDAVILILAFIFNALIIDAAWQDLAIAVGGSVSGSVILAYFRRDNRKFELFLKVMASAIGGLVLGTVLQKYLNIESSEYKLGLFFTTSMLALVILRSLLSLADDNASELLRGLLKRVFNLRVDNEKVKRRVRRNEEKIAELEQDQEKT